MAKNRLSNSLAQSLVDLHSQHGYGYHQYFDWMIDDCLASCGIPLKNIPPEEVHSILFDLGQQYAQCVMESPPFYDVLGTVYMELVGQYGQKALGQYFTPWPVASMMARMVYHDAVIPDVGLYRMSDPACGSGVMALAFASSVMDSNGPEVLKRVSFTGIDVDYLCARLFALQLLGNCMIHRVELGEVLVFHGNALGPLDQLNTVMHTTNRDLPINEYMPAKDIRREPMIQQAATAEQLSLF